MGNRVDQYKLADASLATQLGLNVGSGIYICFYLYFPTIPIILSDSASHDNILVYPSDAAFF